MQRMLPGESTVARQVARTTSGSVEASIANGVATVVINQQARRNALTLEMWDRLGETVRELDQDSSVRVTIIRGAGTEAFSAGADITEFEEKRSTPNKALAYNKQVAQAVHKLVAARKPLIAMIYGFCVGGGCEVALCCDLRIAAEDAVFGIPAARLGISYGHEEIKRLVDLVGPSNAKLIFFTGDPRIPARRAFEMGLINELASTDQLEARVHELVGQMVEGAPSSIRWAKQAIEVVVRDPGLTTVPNSDEMAAQLFGTDDFKEGVAAFLEKRRPRFKWD
jgi:enoyl-CoA hydratase